MVPNDADEARASEVQNSTDHSPDSWGDPLPDHQRVFTNRNLRMESIAAIGFDMDHTLALYDSAEFEQLCFGMAVDLLLAQGYPELVREVAYDRESVVRGLVVDKRLGNILKIDAYGYVARVRQGGRLLHRDERRTAYKRGRIRLGASRYRVVDTLFDLPEGSLYTELIALKDRHPELITASYRQLFDDIREAIDTIHRDGSLKSRIMADIPRYFVRDESLETTLRRLKEEDKKLFLLTNSEPEYTAAVMSHILDSPQGEWTGILDLVICTSQKPAFFLTKGKGRPLPRKGLPGLDNTDGICFTGGDAFFLESKLGVLGDAILYFGDHTYGDILRSKKSVGWRTAMIVPEVEREIKGAARVGDAIRELREIEDSLEDLSRERDLAADGRATPATIEALEQYYQASLGRRSVLQRRIAAVTNPFWGSLFREGRAASRFGAQIRDVACVYTSRVSNFGHYPVEKFFVSAREKLPHE